MSRGLLSSVCGVLRATQVGAARAWLPWRRAVAAAAVAACLLPAAHAGHDCQAERATPDRVLRGMALAQQTAAALDASKARVVVLGRAGQDLQKYGLRWSHLGFAYRTPQGPWRVVHKLNQCGTATADLWRQGLGEFFLDGLWRYEAVWSVPTPEVQTRLLALLTSPGGPQTVNEPAYNLVSYAWGQRYQQSNQWAIETIAAAMEPTTVRSRAQAQAWLRFKGYQPTVLHIGALTRLGGRMGSANIAFDDHPNAERYADRIATVTVDSVFAWLPLSGLGGPVVRLAP